MAVSQDKTAKACEDGLPPAIIIGAEHPRAYAVIRSLGKARVPIISIARHPREPGWASRYIGRKLLYDGKDESLLELLESLGNRRAVLIPTNDDSLICVSKNFERLSQSFIMTGPSWEVLQRLMDKYQCYAFAAEAGLSIPRTYAPRSVNEAHEISLTLDFTNQEYVLKLNPWEGRASRETNKATVSAGHDAATLVTRFAGICSQTGRRPIIQQVVRGETDQCIGVTMVIDRQFKELLSYCVRRLSVYSYTEEGDFAHPYQLGSVVYGETVHDEPALDAARKLVRKANFWGLITVELRRDSTNGTLAFLKTDPRVMRTSSLGTALGMNVPLTIYNQSIGKTAALPTTYPAGVGWIWLGAYAQTLWANRKNRRVRKDLRRVIRNLGKVKATAHLSICDPLPFTRALAQNLAPLPGFRHCVPLVRFARKIRHKESVRGVP